MLHMHWFNMKTCCTHACVRSEYAVHPLCSIFLILCSGSKFCWCYACLACRLMLLCMPCLKLRPCCACIVLNSNMLCMSLVLNAVMLCMQSCIKPAACVWWECKRIMSSLSIGSITTKSLCSQSFQRRAAALSMMCYSISDMSCKHGCFQIQEDNTRLMNNIKNVTLLHADLVAADA